VALLLGPVETRRSIRGGTHPAAADVKMATKAFSPTDLEPVVARSPPPLQSERLARASIIGCDPCRLPEHHPPALVVRCCGSIGQRPGSASDWLAEPARTQAKSHPQVRLCCVRTEKALSDSIRRCSTQRHRSDMATKRQLLALHGLVSRTGSRGLFRCWRGCREAPPGRRKDGSRSWGRTPGPLPSTYSEWTLSTRPLAMCGGGPFALNTLIAQDCVPKPTQANEGPERQRAWLGRGAQPLGLAPAVRRCRRQRSAPDKLRPMPRFILFLSSLYPLQQLVSFLLQTAQVHDRDARPRRCLD
jgi:hypothetical protein